MKKLIQSTEFNIGLPIQSTKNSMNDDYSSFLKYKCSSPAVLGDFYRSITPIQFQLSPIENQQKSCFSQFSDNIEISVKDLSRKMNNISRQSSLPKENQEEQTKIKRIINQENIILQEQNILNKKLKDIRLDTNKKLEELDQIYIKRREEIIQQLENLIGQNNSNYMRESVIKEQPLKSALKKKENFRQHTQDKQNKNYLDEDSFDDWDFIKQAKINLEKQKTSQNTDTDNEKTPSKVRFVNTKEQSKKNLRKSYNLSDLNIFQKIRY